MALTPRHFFLRPPAGRALVVSAAVLAAVGFLVYRSIRQLPAIPPRSDSGKGASSAAEPAAGHGGRISLPMEGWTVFRMNAESVREVSGSLSNRFRLSGTFRVAGAGDGLQKAVLDDANRNHEAVIVATGDKLDDDILVRAIGESRVELIRHDVLCVLTLQFSENGSESGPAVTNGAAAAETGYTVLNRVPFGIQVDANRWVFERRKVLEYYNGVLEDADRLVALFDSLKPMYNDQRKIEGYVLVPEGEKEFFKDVGLAEGDVIRKVNSVPLMNRRVAEGFIRDFGNQELNVAVLEIERGGQPTKLVYELR